MLRIVLADDEILTLAALRVTIEQSGLPFQVVGEATNGLGVVDLCMHNAVDVVITDIRMPTMDGIALMRTLREMSLTPDVIVLTAFRDFEYAIEAIRHGATAYLVKPLVREELIRHLADIWHKRKHHEPTVSTQVAQLVAEHFQGQALPEDASLLLDGSYRLILADAGSADDIPAFSPSLTAVLANRLAFCVNMTSIVAENHLLLLFSPGSKDSYVLRTVQDTLSAHCPATISIGISSAYTGGEMFSGAFKEAEQAMASCFYSEQRVVYAEYSPAQIEEGLPAQELIPIENALYQTVLAGDREKAIDYLCRIKNIFDLRQSVPAADVLWFYRNMLYTMRKNQTYNTGGLKKAAELRSPEIPDTAQRRLFCLHEFFEAQMDELFHAVCASDGTEHIGKVDLIQEFCQQNYSMDISLEMVAGHVGLTKSYLCQLFKEETGVGFWDYLTDLRVESAKRLLEQPGTKASSVGKSVGYHNAGHFGRVFKSRVGVTPMAYKRNIGS